MEKHSPSRRTVVKGAAWAVPAVTIAAAAPALAVSGRVPNVAPVTIPGAGQPVDEPLVITDEKGEVFAPETITNVTGLPEGVQIVKKEDGTFAVVGVVADDTPAGTVPVTAVVTGEDGQAHNVSFDVTVGEPEELCLGGTMSWPATISIYQGLEAEIRDSGESASVPNVPLEITPAKGAGAVQTVSVSGLPAGLTYDPETKLVTGVTYATGTHPVTVQYTTDKNVGCALQMQLTVLPTAVTWSRITENSTMSPSQAGINGIHVTNTSESDITEMEIRIYQYFRPRSIAFTASDASIALAPNITTLVTGSKALTGGETADWVQPEAAYIDHAKKGEAGAIGGGSNGPFVEGATEVEWEDWYPTGPSANALVGYADWNMFVTDADSLETAKTLVNDPEHLRERTAVWVYRLRPGTIVKPGETVHFQLGYKTHLQIRSQFSMGVTVIANGDKQHTTTDETGWFYHSDWNVADAEPRREAGTFS